MPIDLGQSLDNLKLERDAIALYDALAAIEKDPRRADAFRTIAGNERRHAEIWATKLRDLGAEVPPPSGPRLRVRVIVVLARLLGTHAVKDLVQALEGDEEDIYMAQGEAPEVEAIAADEREHAEIWKRLSGESAPRSQDGVARDGGGRRDAAAAVAAGAAGHGRVVAEATSPE
jgi:rubrerythrin